MIELIIFDLDGTLVDSSIDITNAINYAIEPYGLKKLTVDMTIGLVGEGLTRLIEKLLGEDKADLKHDVLQRFLKHYMDHLTDFTVPYPGVLETLEELSDYKKAVISNKREMFSKKLLEDLGLARYFNVILGSDSAGEKKPSPKPLLKVIEQFNIDRDNAVIVGDSNYDIQAGKAAGIKTIAVTYGYRDKSLLKDADYMIDSIRELIPCLVRINYI